MKMINSAKHFSKINVQKVPGFRSKLNHNFLSTGPASEAETKETAEYYDTIATKYHLSNDLLTFGLHRLWRKALVNGIEVRNGTRVLDAPAGTGINTQILLKKSKHLSPNSDFLITMFDINPHMMKVGRDNFKRLSYNSKFVNYVEGNLHQLPFDDDSFDVVISSLANRPYVNYSLVLKEINRVLKPQGKIVMMDFCFSQNPTIIQRMYCNYIEFIASKIEKAVLGNLGSAEFVTKCIRDVVAKSDYQQMLKDANFEKYEFKPFSLGIAGVTVAYKKNYYNKKIK